MMHFLATLLALFATASAVASNAPVDGAPNSNLTVSVDSALASNPTATSSVSTDTGSTEGLADDIAPVMADPVDCNWPSPRDQYCNDCGKNCAGYYADCKKWKCPINAWGCSKVCYMETCRTNWKECKGCRWC